MTGEANRQIVDPACGFFIADAPSIQNTRILKTPRIGIDYAGPVWSKKPYRLILS
jgi:3-methyladenine DNA glycosylase Mpg